MQNGWDVYTIWSCLEYLDKTKQIRDLIAGGLTIGQITQVRQLWQNAKSEIGR